jgi:hypothetical protein
MPDPTDDEDRADLLQIYLDDHLAGATAGSQRAARLADAEQDTADGPALATFAADVATDRDALLALMEAAGVAPSKLKAGIAAVGEKLGALKPNGRLVDRSPLSAIVEIEAMQMAVRGKRSLWETLRVAMPVSTAIDLDGLIARADAQLDVLAALHATRVATTFSAASR